VRGNFYSSVPCPHCGNSTTETTSSSTVAVPGEYRRVRKCPKCLGVFSTFEIYAAEAKFLRVARKAFGDRHVLEEKDDERQA
jgi:transcriptional regulator NrdR family protein